MNSLDLIHTRIKSREFLSNKGVRGNTVILGNSDTSILKKTTIPVTSIGIVDVVNKKGASHKEYIAVNFFPRFKITHHKCFFTALINILIHNAAITHSCQYEIDEILLSSSMLKLQNY